MRYQIKHELKGRLRVHMAQRRMTCREADILMYYIEGLAGVTEARVYENFGRRCQEARYRRLGNLLSQNLKKGSEGLISLLESEAEAGMEERRQQARKLGEEAGTKLLLPMMLMLILVMGILIVPAILNL